MHRVLKAQLKTFSDLHALTMSEDRAFEAFAAFTVCLQFSSEDVEPELLIYEGDDPGIDSALFFVNEKCVLTLEELHDIFKSKKTDHEIVVAFVQTTTSDSWDKSKLNSFESATLDFISDEPRSKLSEYLKESKSIFDFIIDNLGKVKGGKPTLLCYYANSAGQDIPTEIENARKIFENRLIETGLFSSCTCEFLYRDRLLNLYLTSTGNYEAKFPIIGSAAFPKSDGIEEGYVVTVAAKPFIDAVLKDQQGSLRRSIFDENVRDFIALDDSSINTAMREALVNADTSKRFGIMNNGVTIISPDIRIQSNEMYISNYQIVNGCQTSNVLFDARNEIGPDTTLMVKIIETKNQNIVDDIVESTNSQNKIEDHQFLARLECVKGIEKYFRARYEGSDQALFFERRPNQYNNQGLPAVRIFTIKDVARCCGAMFFDRPDLSARYPGQLVEELSEKVFNSSNKEEIFFTSAFCYYRLKLLLSNQKIDSIFNAMKWHALMAIKYFVVGEKIPDVRSPKIDACCQMIYDFMSKNDQLTVQVWKEIEAVLLKVPYGSRDDLRKTRLNADLKGAILGARRPLSKQLEASQKNKK